MVLPTYADLPSFEVFAREEREITAKKIRTVLGRNKPRDVYDLWFLLKIRAIAVGVQLSNKKTSVKLEETVFMKKIEEKRTGWEMELKRFIIGMLPSFDQVECFLPSTRLKMK